AYLRLIAYPNDYISLERIINEPPRGLGPASVRRIIEHARQNGLSIIDALCNASEIPRLTRPQKAASQELGTVLKAVSDVENISTHEIMAYVLEHTGY
ncbi:MAG TPA: ATP-dependent DNA helicase PcrA, partial [Clostridiales bacterium UBA9857]|nr:ATP-dependent DNA helicase PcrA [Clostridiales bacterium UBA9857]